MLQTFDLPAVVAGSAADRRLAEDMIAAWRRDGIFQVSLDRSGCAARDRAFEASRRYFRLPHADKARCVSDLSYTGYIASCEEVTAGEADYSEIFTVCPDLPLSDARVRAGWPCHGPAPWPDADYGERMTSYMGHLGGIGEKLLKLTGLGLGLDDPDALIRLTQDGWHHMRVLRFPALSVGSRRGIGAHTDYGLLVIAAQDDVGGLYVRPPVQGEARPRNWLPGESMTGVYENDEPWTFVTPVPDVLTVFPGDMMQLLSGGYLLSTPHKVRLADRERFAMAYFHEPAFDARVSQLRGSGYSESLHYGAHFTKMFMRSYPDRITTARIVRENRLSGLERLSHPARPPVGVGQALPARAVGAPSLRQLGHELRMPSP